MTKTNKYLIVGLGNPGEKYEKTRHNLGQVFLRTFFEKFAGEGFCGEANNKIKAKVQKAKKVIFVIPETFMNNSGESVKKAAEYYGIEKTKMIIASDDANLEVGQARIRFAGEDGGHNGLKSVIEAIGPDFWRVRIGIGQPAGRIALEDYVLGKIPDIDDKKIAKIVDMAAQKMVSYISQDKLENLTVGVPSKSKDA